MRTSNEALVKGIIVGLIMIGLASSGYAEEGEFKPTQSLFAHPISLRLTKGEQINVPEVEQESSALDNLKNVSLYGLDLEQEQTAVGAFDPGKQTALDMHFAQQLTLNVKAGQEFRSTQSIREEAITSPRVGSESAPGITERQVRIRTYDLPNRFFKTKEN